MLADNTSLKVVIFLLLNVITRSGKVANELDK